MAEELDVISLWKKSKEIASIPSIDITDFDRKPTKTVLFWIKFILLIEFWINVVALPFASYYLLVTSPDLLMFILYIVVTAIYLAYYQFLIRSIKRFNYDQNVVASLKKIYSYLRFYLLHYKVVIWLSLFTGVILGLLDATNQQSMPPDADPLIFWGSVIGITLILVGIVGAIFHLLINLIYGRKIKRLKGIVKSLETSE